MASITRIHGTPILVALAMLGGCSKGPEFARRYSKSVEEPDTDCKSAAVSAFSLPPDDPKPLTVANLQDRGQAAFLSELARKTKDPSSFLHFAATPLKAPSSSALTQDKTRVRRRVAISLENKSLSPADRLSYAQIKVSLDPKQKARFVTWDRLQTEYGQVDLAKISSTQKNTESIAGKLSASVAPAEAELSSSASRERAFSEEVTLRQRYVALSGILDHADAKIIQQSVSGVDLTGNIVVELELRLDEDTDHGPATLTCFSNLRDDNGQPSEPGRVAVEFKEVHFPRIPGTLDKPSDLMAGIALTYRLRKVDKGAETISESDDEVRVLVGSSCKGEEFDLVGANDLRYSTWNLSTTDWRKFVSIEVGGGYPPTMLQFEAPEAANEFLSWLLAASTRQHGRWKVSSRKLSLCEKSGSNCEALGERTAEGLTVIEMEWNWKVSTPGASEFRRTP